jgi:hypothetical protein
MRAQYEACGCREGLLAIPFYLRELSATVTAQALQHPGREIETPRVTSALPLWTPAARRLYRGTEGDIEGIAISKSYLRENPPNFALLLCNAPPLAHFQGRRRPIRIGGILCQEYA